jgi:hypothetical protein
MKIGILLDELAERLDVGTIATVNRRDFTVVRPTHIEAFTHASR